MPTQVFTGAIPFSNSLPAVAALAIMGGERPPRPTHLALTDRLWSLLQQCWDQDPRLRPNISEVLRILAPSVPRGDPFGSTKVPSAVGGDAETDTDSQSYTTANGLGMFSTFNFGINLNDTRTGLPTLDNEKELPGSGATSPAISFYDEKFMDPPRKIRAKESIWVCRLARNARKMFKAISSILCGL